MCRACSEVIDVKEAFTVVITLKKIRKVLTKIFEVALILLLTWMVISLGIQVIGRYIFHKGFIWSEESARYCMIWLVFIGSTEIVFNSRHIRVTVIEDILKGAGQKIIQLIQYLIASTFTGLVFLYSIDAVKLASMATSSNMNINMGIVYGLFPVVSALMIIGYIFQIILLFADKDGNQSEEQGEQI